MQYNVTVSGKDVDREFKWQVCAPNKIHALQLEYWINTLQPIWQASIEHDSVCLHVANKSQIIFLCGMQEFMYNPNC